MTSTADALHLPGACLCGLGVGLALLAHRSGRDASRLAAEPPMTLSELRATRLPRVVCCTGRCGSDKPLRCEHATVTAVATELDVTALVLQRNPTGEWHHLAVPLSRSSKVTPFYIDAGGRVNVSSAPARGPRLVTVYDSFEAAQEGSFPLIHSASAFLRGLQPRGTRTTERAIPVDTQLTVIGEAHEMADGVIELRPPEDRPFIVTTLSHGALCAELGAVSSLLATLAAAALMTGAALVGRRLWLRLRGARRAADLQRRAMEAARLRALAKDGTVDEAAAEAAAALLCVLCIEAERDTVFQACGHLVACRSCAARLPHCPICRTRGPVLRVFRA